MNIHAVNAGSVVSLIDPEELRNQLGSGPIAVLTGAGLSTASGIPAYRVEHGAWRHPPPIQHQAFLKNELTRRRYWARSFVGWQYHLTCHFHHNDHELTYIKEINH